jgi:hypothetical protein
MITHPHAQSIVHSTSAPRSMFFRLGAACKATFTGTHHVHGVVMHQFSTDTAAQLRLAARARQFSRYVRTHASLVRCCASDTRAVCDSFILMIGTILSADEFAPTHAVIVKDKDELLIPLLLETMPSPKEVRLVCVFVSPYVCALTYVATVPRRDRVSLARAAAIRQGVSCHAGVCVVMMTCVRSCSLMTCCVTRSRSSSRHCSRCASCRLSRSSSCCSNCRWARC